MTDKMNSQPSSWSDLVRSVDKDRKQLPWDPSKVQPVERVSLYHRKRQEREFDPVAMSFRDQQREEQFQRTKDDTIRKKVDMVNTMRAEKYDIVGHFGPPRKIDSMKREHVPDHPTNILSNLHWDDHTKAPLIDDGSFALTRFRPNTVRAKTSIAKQREFNVISNEYNVDHEKRRLEDFDKLKTHLLKKYWDTHDYDVVKGRFCSPEKQQLIAEQKKATDSVQGLAQEARLPPSLRYDDGKSYNIMTHDVYDEEKLSSSMIITTRSLNRVKKLQKEAEHKEKGAQESSIKEQKHMNRISFKHWEGQIDRGYNFITNKVVNDAPLPLPNRPVTMWARLTTGPSSPRNNNDNDLSSTLNSRNTLDQSQDLSSGFSKRGPFAGTRQSNEIPEAAKMATNRVRNLSGAGPLFSSTSLPAINPDSTRPPASTRKNMETSQIKSGKIPSLDLSRADFAEPVSYQEPKGAPPGLAIPMVRTGGLSSHRVQ